MEQLLIGEWGKKPAVATPPHRVPYKEMDLEIARCSHAVEAHAGQLEYQARGEAYKRKAMMAAVKEDVAMYESCVKGALADFSQALAQGDSGQLSKVDWFVQRGVLHKELAGTLPPGCARKAHMLEALRDFSNALHLSHNTSNVLSLRGDVRCALGMFEPAIDDYTTALPTAAPSGKIKALRGRALAWCAVGELGNAYTDMSQAIHVCTSQEAVDQKELAELLFTRANVAGKMGRKEQCLQDVGKSLELQPNFVQALEMRAVLCYQCGIYQEASNDLCDALRLGAEDSEVLSDLYRKLKNTQTVYLHIVRGTDLVPAGDARPHEYFVRYAVGVAGGGLKPIVEGRTLTSATAEWGEVIQLEIPGRAYAVDLSVRDECPQTDAPFLGRCTIDLSVLPEGASGTLLPLHPMVNRRTDMRLFAMTTGGKGMLEVEWRMQPRLPAEAGAGGLSTRSPHCTGIATDGQEIADMFKQYDRRGVGFLTRAAVKAVVQGFETFGLPQEDVDEVLNQYKNPTDDKVTLEEFTLLMLRVARR